MTQSETNNLKKEITMMVDLVGFNFMECSWLDKLSIKAKGTLREYFVDAESLSKREISIMLYKNKDAQLWNHIMANIR